MLVARVIDLQHVEPDVEIMVGRVEVDDVFDAVRRAGRKDGLDELAMRVDDGHAFPVPDVLDDHVRKEHGLTGTGLSEHVHVLAAVAALDAEDLVLGAEVGLGKVCDVLIEVDTFREEIHISKYIK